MAEIQYSPATVLPSVDKVLSLLEVNWNIDSITMRSRIMDIAPAEDESDVETTDSGGRPGPASANGVFSLPVTVIQSWYPRAGIVASISSRAGSS